MAETYKPGDKVPKSGIYDVVHDVEHIEQHQVTCVKDETFPPCNHCGRCPRFTLYRAAHYIANHKLFR
jgi:hypothetical protein